MPRTPSFTLRLSLGMGIAALTVIPMAMLGLGQLQRIETGVELLIRRHVRQESFGNQYLVSTAVARRALRSFTLLGDSTFAARTRENIAFAVGAAESLVAVFEDSLAAQSLILARHFSAEFESLATLSSMGPANLARLRDHTRSALNARRGELDRLLKSAASSMDPAAKDSLLHAIESSLRALDLDTLLVSMPVAEQALSRSDVRLDSLSRVMTTVGDEVVCRARNGIERDAIAIATLVSRGERNLLAVLLITAILAAVWVVYFPRTLDIPLRRFVNMVRRAAQGDLDRQIAPSHYRELEDLADAICELLEFMKRADELRSEKVRVHWRRLQLLARDSSDFWCITDGTGRSVLMSAPLSQRVSGREECQMPPRGFSVLKRHQLDPTDPGQGFVLWLGMEGSAEGSHSP